MPGRSRRRSAPQRDRRPRNDAKQNDGKLDTSVQGLPSVEVGGSVFEASTPDQYLVGAGVELAKGSLEAGIDEDGIYGSASISAGEVSARLGRDDDVAQIKGTAQGPNASAEGRLGWDGFGFDADASLGDISAEGHLGRRGTDRDAAITGGVELGGGAGAKLNVNLGNDTDGDGIPNYGFDIGAKLGLGLRLGVDVEPQKYIEAAKEKGRRFLEWVGF